MALSASGTKRHVLGGGLSVVTGTIAFDNSYPTGGELYTSILNANKLIHLQAGPHAGYQFEWDRTNKKILVKAPISVAGGAAAAGTDALSIKSNVVNKESAGVAHSAAKEVPSTTDLSVTCAAVPFLAFMHGA